MERLKLYWASGVEEAYKGMTPAMIIAHALHRSPQEVEVYLASEVDALLKKLSEKETT
jgi:hypothetical protein